MSSFTATTVREGNRAVVSLVGEVDHSNCDQLTEALSSAQPAEVVVLDCAGLDFIDSRGINAILGAQQEAAAASFELRNASPMLRRLISVLGLDERLPAP